MKVLRYLGHRKNTWPRVGVFKTGALSGTISFLKRPQKRFQDENSISKPVL
jgi:hypothetical protein